MAKQPQSHWGQNKKKGAKLSGNYQHGYKSIDSLILPVWCDQKNAWEIVSLHQEHTNWKDPTSFESVTVSFCMPATAAEEMEADCFITLTWLCSLSAEHAELWW